MRQYYATVNSFAHAELRLVISQSRIRIKIYKYYLGYFPEELIFEVCFIKSYAFVHYRKTVMHKYLYFLILTIDNGTLNKDFFCYLHRIECSRKTCINSHLYNYFCHFLWFTSYIQRTINMYI